MINSSQGFWAVYLHSRVKSCMLLSHITPHKACLHVSSALSHVFAVEGYQVIPPLQTHVIRCRTSGAQPHSCSSINTATANFIYPSQQETLWQHKVHTQCNPASWCKVPEKQTGSNLQQQFLISDKQKSKVLSSLRAKSGSHPQMQRLRWQKL